MVDEGGIGFELLINGVLEAVPGTSDIISSKHSIGLWFIGELIDGPHGRLILVVCFESSVAVPLMLSNKFAQK